MKFFDCATAPSPRRVRIFLSEKGITVPTVQVDLRNNEQLTPAFRAINPDATVPALELDDGTRINDEHIDVTWLGGNLLLAQSKNSSDAVVWESYITLDSVVPHIGKGFFQYKGRVDFGTHLLQRTREKDKIFVTADNPAFSDPAVNYIWKKRAPPEVKGKHSASMDLVPPSL